MTETLVWDAPTETTILTERNIYGTNFTFPKPTTSPNDLTLTYTIVSPSEIAGLVTVDSSGATEVIF